MKYEFFYSMINFLKGKRGKYEEDYAEKVIYLVQNNGHKFI